MDKARILELMTELEAVLSEERAGHMEAPPGFTMTLITPETIEANEEQPVLLRSLEITAQLLQLCPGSKGMRQYLLEVVDTWCRLGMPAGNILGFFGALEDDWDLFDPSAIKECEYKWLESDTRSLFFFLLGMLGIMISEEQANKVSADKASELFEQTMTSPAGSWLTPAQLQESPAFDGSLRNVWHIRFEQTRRILAWVGSYKEKYGEAPADFENLIRRMEKFLEYS